MGKNLMPKFVLIIILILLAIWTLYPPSQTLKPGIDLAGGSSLIFEIDTFGMTEAEKHGLSERMITVLRRRIDPANIQNLVWRPIGNDRFEIQLPLASAEARQKRQDYEDAENALINKNLSRSDMSAVLKRPAQERSESFAELAQGDPNRLEILENLAEKYDRRMELINTRDELFPQLNTIKESLSAAGMDIEELEADVVQWAKIEDGEILRQRFIEVTDSNDNIELLSEYVNTFSQWAPAVDELSEIQPEYNEAINSIDRLNLSREQLLYCLELEDDSERKQQIAQLKADFPDRVSEIENVVDAYEAYSPYKGRLDDPSALKRMLKGAGILEFRVLPTQDPSKVDMDLMQGYYDRLVEKGPEYASDSEYLWCEIENYEQWDAIDADQNPSIVGSFGGKYFVLASNKANEIMLHTAGTDESWKLESATQTTDTEGKRAIGFDMDQKGGKLFAKITEENIGRPLCILLDGQAISAPNINEKIPRGEGIIKGNFTQTEVEDMVDKLNAGTLPARLIEQTISENTIGPSIGAANRDQGIRAGFIGLIVVIACMAIYYCLAGTIADAALVLNILFVLAIMAGIMATFTLPGIAGIILTIGMSVDANVLIFERIREEQLKGSSLRVAITNGYEKAFRTILDANLTTLITAAILYWRASEEVRGFAIVLMLGIVSSMFTALFATRVVFDFLLNKRFIKDHLVMLRLIHNPSVNWMKSRPVFFTISAVLIAAGLFSFYARNDKYDIEFIGGSNVRINIREDLNLTRRDIADRIHTVLTSANVYSVGSTGKEFEITTTETNKLSTTMSLPKSDKTISEVTAAIQKAQNQFADKLRNLAITPSEQNPGSFEVTTSQTNKTLFKEILTNAFPDAEISEPQVDEFVNNSILSVFADELEIQQNLQPTIASVENINEEMLDTYPALAEFTDGDIIRCDIERAASLQKIEQRFKDLLFQPDMQDLQRYNYILLDSNLNIIADSNTVMNSFAYVSTHNEAGLRELTEDERERFIDNEQRKVLGATQLEASLSRVRQFDPSVGAEQKTRALIAIILSLFAIVAYIWVRFGNVRYGIAAIVALIHDVCITLGAVTACKYLAGTAIGNALLISDFKIDLAMIAAFLTLIGYSLNDTIVVFDRIRENRGKARDLTPQTITDSINQTISRTIMTSFTTFIVVLIMYIFGGQGLRGFTFAIGFGIIIGTYSSIAIAAPVLLIGTKKQNVKK